MNCLYTVWFRNGSLPSDDPDHEWPACFVIAASSQAAAKAWGDHLGQRYARARDQWVVGSAVEPIQTASLPGVAALPLVMAGEEADDAHIGW